MSISPCILFSTTTDVYRYSAKLFYLAQMHQMAYEDKNSKCLNELNILIQFD